jgi:hypothetical protein
MSSKFPTRQSIAGAGAFLVLGQVRSVFGVVVVSLCSTYLGSEQWPKIRLIWPISDDPSPRSHGPVPCIVFIPSMHFSLVYSFIEFNNR